MASVDKVPTGWRARWRTPAGASRSQTFGRKIDAERHLTGVEHSKLTGGYVDPAGGRQTFRDYAEAWRVVQPHRESTAETWDTVLRVHTYPVLGDRPIAAIRRTEIQAWLKVLRDTMSPGYLVLCRAKVSAVFNAAVVDRVITANPCKDVRVPRPEVAEVFPLAPADVSAVADSVSPRYRLLILMAAATGMRQGELLGLTLDRVDFLRRTIRVNRQMVSFKQGRTTFGPTKTKASIRTLSVHANLLEEVNAHLARFGPGPDGLVFTTSAGMPVRSNTAVVMWARAAAKAGVTGRTFHDLRHYCASVLISSGASVKVVQRHLGHATVSQTLDVYSHLWPEDEDRTREAMGVALRAVVSQTCHEATGREA